ncbi:MAG: TonB-dependent receptor [Candidatus Azobacteroides sp.]|nr:TonB-dependent receptor [Candidatus Azobacteroides sp.]
MGYKYTTYGSTALNRYNGSDPRPDYYRYLPSYQSTPEMQEYYREKWLTDPTVSQVNWNRLYEVNRLNQPDDRGSVYIVEERHNDQSNFTLNSTFNTKLTDRISLTAGLEGRTTRGMHYKTVSDLLGGDFFLDVNQFAQTDFGYDSEQAQYDLNNPNRKATEGDRFGYDYDIYVHSGNAWFQNVHRYNKWDIFYGHKLTYTNFYRKGHMRNGLAPDNSYGKGETHSFTDQESKFGLTYKLSGKHIFSGTVSYATLAPLTYNAYLSPRVKDAVIPDLKSERVFSSEVSYSLSTPLVTGKITAYQTNFYDQARMYNLYYDLDGTFVNYALTGIDKIHRGLELGVEIKLNSNFTLSGIGTISEYYYSNRPTGTISYENGSAEDKTETVYLKNFYVAGTPQMAGNIGLHYFNNYWFLDLKLNGFDRTYIDLSPMKRTESAISSLDAYTYEELEEIVANATKQEKFAGGGTLDFSIGKVFRIQRKYTMTVNLQFNNILNNKNLKTGGYEYNRIDTDDVTSNKFPSYYYYAQGFNCYLSAGFRF